MKKALVENGKSGPLGRKLGANSDQTISAVLETAAVGAVLHAILIADRSGTILWVNDAFTRLTGYGAEEALGQNTRLLKSGQHSEAFYRSIWNRVLGGETWIGEIVNRRKDGSLYREEMSAAPIRDANGEIAHFFCIKLDVTARRHAEETLRQTEEQFRHLAENIREIFFVVTPDPLRMEYISPAHEEITGQPRQMVYDNAGAWLALVHPEDRERVAGLFGRSMAGLQVQMEYRLIRTDGKIRWLDARSFPVRDAEGKLIRIVGIAEDVTARKQKEEALSEAHGRLNAALAISQRQAEDAARLTELVDILQSCQTVGEAYRVAESVLHALLPSRCGSLCLTSPSRNVVEAVATWGQPLSTEKTFAPEDCWALRRGKPHVVNDAASPLRCAHITAPSAAGHICIPLAAQGETIGVLYLECNPSVPAAMIPSRSDLGPAAPVTEGESRDDLVQRATAAGERVSLAIANLQLREVLRRQSIRDSLTGLYNRRYMEESLERELRRASRAGDHAAVLMLDLDHFKQFNDTFGHQAGDALLRAFGEFLNQRSRAQDVACRYGGEEFALILSGAGQEAALRRAELLREDLRNLSVQHAGELLQKVTVSVGIGVFPANGPGAAEMLQSADRALYRAKSEGRDRAVVC